ncbi:helix-turn-helix transcriptional regulator [Mesorhizobium sp.]|uniref:helix-turn-helix transcriptional regulator n=1 Tax=Mesorhizobium sp. TaxID=1871066 RepID=UPI000FE71F3E|nr:helix-turn-helix transcriptional regulator [Mesorhizobium sp.]RWD97794.1 MAG: helix-turn-helix transcriptional regulator [Mesorhizobium sp.]
MEYSGGPGGSSFSAGNQYFSGWFANPFPSYSLVWSGEPKEQEEDYKSLWQLLHAVEPASSTPPVALPRVGRRPLLAYPMRLPAVSPNALAPCQAAVVLLDPDSRPRPPEAVLRSCFGLTVSEARLACHVSSGEALEAAADELAISYETARNHLKAIFAKTDTHRQAELIALLARVANGPQGGR